MIIKEKNLTSLSDKNIVLTVGCFDLLHEGHIRFLSESKKYGDFLITFVLSDKLVKTKKGKDRPRENENIRLNNIDSLDIVDYCLLIDNASDHFFWDILYPLIDKLMPNVICFGEDTIVTKEETAKLNNKDIKLVKIKKFKDFSTTKIIKNLDF